MNITCHVIPVKYDYHGYLKQMAVKANSFKDVKTTYTAIVESDIIFKHRFHINDLVATTNKKLQWTYWDNLPEDSEVKIWKKASAKFQEMHGMDYDSWCAKGCKENNIAINAPLLGPNSMFSKITTIFEEFEWLGFFCHHFSNDYVFLPTTATHHWSHKNKNVSPHCVQFWSHGGITPEIEAQIKQLLK